MTDRGFALWYAGQFIGNWYKWGGDDPSGFDCSGFIIEVLKAMGKIHRKTDFTAQRLYEKFKHLEVDKPGVAVLVFYHQPIKGIFHVEMCVDEKRTIGASGGDSRTLTVQDAIRKNAFIKIRPLRSYPTFFVDVFGS